MYDARDQFSIFEVLFWGFFYISFIFKNVNICANHD